MSSVTPAPAPVSWVIALLGLSALHACTADDQCNVSVRAASLTNGEVSADYLRLEPWQRNAIVGVELTFASFPYEAQCSGVLVAEQTVLTAKHCLQGQSASSIDVWLGPSEDNAFRSSAQVASLHTELDAMLLELDVAPSAELEVAPLTLSERVPPNLARGQLVQLAGVGSDERGAVGVRAFSVEEVVEIGAQEIIVTSRGRGGACSGDSGGPLLTRDEGGEVRVLGVLRAGSASCFGDDIYSRADVLLNGWEDLEQLLATEWPVDRDLRFEALGGDGRCFGNTAVWSQDGKPSRAICQHGQRCGWNVDLQKYGCVDPAQDPCRGIDDVGVCEDGDALRCVRGELVRNPCSECGFVCARSPRTGSPVCVSDETGRDGD